MIFVEVTSLDKRNDRGLSDIQHTCNILSHKDMLGSQNVREHRRPSHGDLLLVDAHIYRNDHRPSFEKDNSEWSRLNENKSAFIF